VSENVVATMLEAAGLAVARGRIARTLEEAVQAAAVVGYPVAIKGISSAVTHRAAAGLVALNLESPDAVSKAVHTFGERATALGVRLEGVWVQAMFEGKRELLVTAFRDREFGMMVGCGMGGVMTEIIDDVVFARAPVDAEAAFDLLRCLRSVRRLPELFTETQLTQAAQFVAAFTQMVATAPWPRFTFEVNPLKIATDTVAAVDGLLVIE